MEYRSDRERGEIRRRGEKKNMMNVGVERQRKRREKQVQGEEKRLAKAVKEIVKEGKERDQKKARVGEEQLEIYACMGTRKRYCFGKEKQIRREYENRLKHRKRLREDYKKLESKHRDADRFVGRQVRNTKLKRIRAKVIVH